MADYMTLEILHQHFILDGDKLLWNPARPKSHFKNDRAHNAYMSTKAGREAGSSDVSIGGYKQSYVLCADGKKRLQYNHRLIWAMANNRLVPSGFVVDHRDCNPANNHPSNLRLVGAKINARNRKPMPGQIFGARKYTTKRKGVYFIAFHEGRRIDNTRYATAEEAGKARDLHIIALGLEGHYQLNYPIADNTNSAPKEAAA